MHILDPLRRAFRWHRRTFAALLAGIAVLAGLSALTSRTSGGAPTVVAARSIAAGSRVGAADLSVLPVPAGLRPEGSLADPQLVVGRTVVVAVPARQPVTPEVLLDGGLQVAAGRVALPVRFGETAPVALLRVGGRIDLLGPAGDGTGFGVVAGAVRVVAISEAGDPGVLGGAGAPFVLVDVTPAQAAAIAAAAGVSALSFALR